MPLLTIALTGRGDDYNPGYAERVKMSLQSFVSVFKDIDVELLLIDFNQIKGKPFSNIYSHPKIKNIVVKKSIVKNRMNWQFRNGVSIIRENGSKMGFRDFFRIFSFPPGWALNEGLKHATGEYFVFTSTDVIVCKKNLDTLLGMLRPKVMFKCSSMVASQDYVRDNLSAIIDSPYKNSNLSFSRYYTKNYTVGNGLFCIIDTKSARDIGGSLPYLIHRSKGADFFASFISSALGHESCIPDYRVVEIDHRKSKSVIPLWNYKTAKFDHDRDYEYVRNWVKNNAPKNDFNSVRKPYFFNLSADASKASQFLEAFKNYY